MIVQFYKLHKHIIFIFWMDGTIPMLKGKASVPLRNYGCVCMCVCKCVICHVLYVTDVYLSVEPHVVSAIFRL